MAEVSEVKVPERRAPLDSMERARWELAAMAGRLRSLEARLVDEQQQTESMRRERDRERKRLDKLRGSESYRIGYGLVSLIKDPVHSVPRLSRAVLRRLRRRHRPAPLVTARPPVAPQRPAVTLYVAMGGDLRAFVRTLQQRLQVSDDHRPVVLTDDPAFSLLRDAGILLEYLPDRATWEQRRPDQPWDEVLAERLSRLHRDHDAVRTVVVDGANPPTLADLLR